MRDPESTIKGVRRTRRAAGAAAGAGKVVFRAGKLWGRATRAAQGSSDGRGAYLAAGGAGLAAGAAGGYFLDPQGGKRRRHVARDKIGKLLRSGARRARRRADYAAGVAEGKVEAATTPSREAERLNDPALARKVESEVFRGDEVPKGAVNVNVEHRVVYLRGQLDSTTEIDRIVGRAAKVKGVRAVENLLHPPGEPPRAKSENQPRLGDLARAELG